VGGTPVIRDSSVSGIDGVWAHGILAGTNGAPKITNSTISGTGGTYNYGILAAGLGSNISLEILNSRIVGSYFTVWVGSGWVVRIAVTQLDGGQIFRGSTVTCVGAFDENYTSLAPASC
ncbi:MAG: hypothetical protein IT424_16185, partial [Pirellulales bacterium]|nr:hypothetical protein [Pirellulales bacterium]